MGPRGPEGATLSFLRGLSVHRWGTWVWMTIVAAWNADEMRDGRAWMAIALLAAAFAVTVAAGLLRSPPTVAASSPRR